MVITLTLTFFVMNIARIKRIEPIMSTSDEDLTTMSTLSPKTMVITDEGVTSISVENGTTTSSLCSSFIPKHKDQHSSSSIWHGLKNAVLNASYFPEKDRDNAEFRQWVKDMLQFHTGSRLRRSVSHSAESLTIQTILQVIEKRKDGSDEPLRIMVMGGSVASGINCSRNPIGLGERGYMVADTECAWPARLEHMFNHVFFDGESVVEITNLATGGSSSEVGTVIMDYHLFPKPSELPHVIISAYAPNDAQQPSLENVFYVEMQNYIKSAQKTRRCDSQLPLIIMADEFYGFNDVIKQNLHSGNIYILSSWYNLMTINHANVAKHEILSNYNNTSVVSQLMGSGFDLHMGMGFHIGMAWTVLFNFLNAFVDTCNDSTISPNDKAQIDSVLQSLPARHVAKLSEGEAGKVGNILEQWKANSKEEKNICSILGKEMHTNISSSPCTYAWMVNRQTDIMRPNDIVRHLAPILRSNQGWKATGKPIQQPRTGWYAQEANATFTLEVLPTFQTNFLTIVSMKSYGPTFVGSKLLVTISVRGSIFPNTTTNSSQGNNTDAIIMHVIDGYHSTKTSVHFPHKLKLPGDIGANIGDSVLVEVKLVGGSSFKINGFAFCRF